MSNLSEQEKLVDQARRGNLTAFWHLVETHGPMIRRLLYRLVGDRETADDLFSETFLRASDRIDQFRGESRFSTWLSAIAVNLAKNHMQRARRRTTIAWEEVIPRDAHRHGQDAPTLASWADPHKLLEQKELAKLMASALDELPPRYRTVFVLRDVEGLSTQETARALGLSETAVKSRAVRARLALRKYLAPYLKEEKKVAHRA